MANWWDDAPIVEQSKPAGNWWDAAPLVEAEAPSSAQGIAVDIAKSGGAGAVRGVADVVGWPGTLGDGLNAGAGWLLKKGHDLVTGQEAEPGTFFGGNAIPSSAVGGNAMRGYAAAATGGASDYQPKTTAGEYARTIGEFAPAAALGGPTAMLRNAVIPAVASEGAGQLTEDTVLEPWARVAGAIAGGGIGQAMAPAQKAAGQTARQVLNEGGELFEAAKPVMQNTQITNEAYRRMASGMAREAKDFGLVPGEHNAIIGILNKTLAGAKDKTPSLQDIEIIRRQLNNAGKSIANKSASELAGRLVDKLDDAVETLGTANIHVGDAANAAKTLDQIKEARGIWRTGRKAELIENAMEAGKNAASGAENGLRVEFRKLLNNPKLARNFSDAEKVAIKKVANGTLGGNAARLAGTFGVSLDNGRNAVGAWLGGGAGMALGGPYGMLAVGAGGTGARMLSKKLTTDAAKIVDQMVKAGPKAQEVFNQLTRTADQQTRTAILKSFMQANTASKVPATPIPAR